MLAKKKLIFCLLETGGGGGGGNIEVVSKSQKMSFFVGHFMKKSQNKKAHFLGFGDLRWGGEGGNFQLSPGDKI